MHTVFSLHKRQIVINRTMLQLSRQSNVTATRNDGEVVANSA
jgi:hypothetical protein